MENNSPAGRIHSLTGFTLVWFRDWMRIYSDIVLSTLIDLLPGLIRIYKKVFAQCNLEITSQTRCNYRIQHFLYDYQTLSSARSCCITVWWGKEIHKKRIISWLLMTWNIIYQSRPSRFLINSLFFSSFVYSSLFRDEREWFIAHN